MSENKSRNRKTDIPLFSNWLEAIAKELRNGDLDKAIEQTNVWLRSAQSNGSTKTAVQS